MCRSTDINEQNNNHYSSMISESINILTKFYEIKNLFQVKVIYGAIELPKNFKNRIYFVPSTLMLMPKVCLH